MQRRRFLFWVGLGLFNLGETLRTDGLDELAAAIMDGAENPSAVHWRAANNSAWQWYERETLVNGRWMLTGITTPINRETGQAYDAQKGYLDASLVPAELRVWDEEDGDRLGTAANAESDDHPPDATRRARHGRPPSKWLRSLHADELRIWLKTIDVPEASVSGMTYFLHLTRDHFFDAEKIQDLTVDEQARLHAAAHYGY
jgi:hypothetical protein